MPVRFDSDYEQLYHPRAMGQRAKAQLLTIFCLIVSAAVAGCDRPTASTPMPAPTTSPATRPGFIKVASLVPAATDLILGMGAGDHLVAVTKYDKDRPETHGLPLAGDYLSTDWEQLATLRPDVMIVAVAPDRLPAGTKQRAEQFHIRLINVKTDRLADLFPALERIGEALNEPQKAQHASDELRRRLDAVRQRVSASPRVPTLIMLDEKAENVVGRDNFLNDLLEVAGGENVIGPQMTAWPKIDREMLMSLKPQAVLQLLVDDNEAGAGQAELTKRLAMRKQEAKRLWASMADLPAMRQDRVYILSDWYLLLPGYHVADVAEKFAKCLHPEMIRDP